ncbi:Fructose-bisphosphate aldolase [invertebrate metagenome]|uniref:Fructose-bisphosphate aldolase n=1 Tax=invertebrate metagenome TaxID=1711999 RepID=A0A2H9T6X1_9ZZZZ
MLVNLNDLLPEAAQSDYAVPCFNVFGYEDARAVTEAAEQIKRPVILAANKHVVDFMGIEHAAKMLRLLAENTSVPVCVHLDHTYEASIVYQGIRHGFSSVMIDGSQLTLEANIEKTRKVVDVAHACGVSVEGEIGSVPYDDIRPHIKTIATDPEIARIFSEESGVDAVAVSVGNIHRLTEPVAVIDHKRLEDIARKVSIPLVIHGTSGIPEADIRKMCHGKAAKFNIGTVLRMAFGHRLRHIMAEYPDAFDRLFFMEHTIPAVREAALGQMQLFYGADFH